MPIPEKIKIGDKEYVVKDTPEILEAIQEARKEEKTKLYSQIQSLEAQKKVLEDKEATNGTLTKTQEAELNKLREELGGVKAAAKAAEEALKEATEAKKKAEEGGEEKGDKTKKTVAGMSEEQVKKLLEEQQKAFEKTLAEKLSAVNSSMTQKDVEQYRKEQIEANKDSLIARFVPANLKTKEEVNQAIAEAITDSKPFLRKEYEHDGKKGQYSLAEIEELEKAKAAAAAQQAQQQQPTGTWTPGAAPAKPDAGPSDLTGKKLLENVANMSPEEYNKHRDAILREAKGVAYSGSNAE